MSSPPFDVLEYEDATGYSAFREWRKALRRSNPRASAKVDWLVALLEQQGTALRFPYVSHIEGPIYELRARSGDTVRIYYWQQEKEIFVAAAGELKQKKKADQKLIQAALAAHKEYNDE